jgi:glycosyltransferase involved in cell wall biosynthesis
VSGAAPDLAFFLPSLRGGGAERVVMDLARAAADRGRRVDVVIVNRVGAITDDLGPGVEIVDLDRPRTALAGVALARYLRSRRPPALLATLEHANVLAVLVGRLVGRVRVVLREANTPSADLAEGGWKGRALRVAMRLAYRRADAVIAVSRGVASSLRSELGLPAERIRIVANPVLTPRLRAGAQELPQHPWLVDGGPPVVLGVGRLARQKGFDVLLRAFARVRERRPARLLVLGEGERRADLEALAGELGVADDVALPGFAANPFAAMSRCAVFVLSSRWEGLPNVLIQALAVGAPVVATDCPSGPDEVLDEGRYGRLVPVDDVAAMADAIDASLRDPFPPPPDAWSRRYQLDAVADAYLTVLEADRGAEGPR